MPDTSPHRHHAIDYVEISVTDVEQAKLFDGSAIGWEVTDYGPENAGIKSPHNASAPEDAGGLRRDPDVRAGLTAGPKRLNEDTSEGMSSR